MGVSKARAHTTATTTATREERELLERW